MVANRPTLFQIKQRHAECYVRVLADLQALYAQRGAAMAAAFQRFEALWPQIKQGQAWAAAHAHEGAHFARLCFEYAWYSDILLQTKGFSRERINWIEQAISVTGHPETLSVLFSALGEEYNAVRDYDRALVMHEVALLSAEELALHEYAIGVLTQKATTLKNQGKLSEAKACFDQAIELSKQKLGAPPGFSILNNLGNLLDEMKQPARALYYLKRAERMAARSQHLLQRATVSLNMVEPLLRLQRYDEALRRAQTAHGLFEQIGTSAGLAKAKAALAITYEQLGDYERSAEWSQAASRIVNDVRFDLVERYAFQHIEAGALERVARLADARESAQRILREAQTQDDKPVQLRALKTIGHTLQSQHHFADARRSWQQALDLANELDNKPDQIKLTAAIGLTYINDDLNTAIAYYERALYLATEHRLPQKTANILANLGNAYLWTNHTQEAMRCYEEGLERARADEEPQVENRIQAYIAQWHLLQSRTEQAVAIYKERLPFFEQTSDWYYMAWMGLQYSIALWLLGKQEEAVAVCRQALQQAQTVGISQLAAMAEEVVDDMKDALSGGEPFEPIVDIAAIHALGSAWSTNAAGATSSSSWG